MREGADPRVWRGRRLGEFVVGERLGGGGFGDVYQASQPSLGRAAVIKVLRGTAEPRRVRRFEQEARVACQLDHPYAAHVYAFGVEADALMWIAMELVRGISLAEWLETKGPIPLGRFVGLFERLCEVVHTAHQAGLVHRDIKPANVMVVTRAGKLMPKLLDFGIATDLDRVATSSRAVAAPSIDDARWTDSTDPTDSDDRDASGTPAYMAPEQWQGTGHDHRVDVYALGVLAFRCLTGRAPIVGKSPRELYLAHHQQAMPELPREFPVALDGVLRKALAKDPDARYRSALELAAAFQGAAVGETSWLPREEVRPWLASAPPHLAASVTAVVAARSGHDACEASQRLLEALAQWLGTVALAAAASLGTYTERSAQIAKLRTEPLAPRDWLELAAGLCAPHAECDENFPIPEMVRWFVDQAGSETMLAALAALREAAAFPRDLITRVLHGLRFLVGYTLLAGDEEWTIATHERIAAGTIVWISDGDRNALFELTPLVVAAAPSPGDAAELFAVTGGGRTGARQLAYPRGYERESDAVWPWLEAHFAIGTTTRDATIVDRPPYRGLAPFAAADNELFFGRTRVVDQLFNRMLGQPFVAVVGPSGSGKSSLVFAGLIPRLPEDWIALAMRPRHNPLAAFDATLLEAGLPGVADVAAIVPRLRELDRRLLLVIDQAEELLTVADLRERGPAAAVLAQLAAAGSDRVRVIVTLRHDFIGRTDELPAWRELIQHNLFVVTVPTHDELAQMVTGPAAYVGYGFDDPRLVPDMVAEVADRPGVLPLLSFAASRLWDARDREAQQLTRAAYVAMGGVGGALARYAEETFAALSPRQQTLVRELLRRLITAEGTSAPSRRDELVSLGDGADVVLDALIDARILVENERADSGEDITIAHEALIDRWPRLVQWRADDAAGARHLDELRAAAALWIERGRDPSYLWRGDALAIYRQWARRWAGALTAHEVAFAEASVRAVTRARRARRLTIAAALAALSAAVVVLVLLYRRSSHDRDQAEQRFTDMLVDRGRTELSADRPLRALVYLAAAYQRGRDDPGIRVSLGAAARAMDREVARARAHAGYADLSTFDDTALTFADGDPPRAWRIRDGTIKPTTSYRRADGADGVVSDVGFRGDVVGSVGPHKPLVLWDRAGNQIATYQHDAQLQVGAHLNIGSMLITMGLDREIGIWDRDARFLGTLSNPARPAGTDALGLAALHWGKAPSSRLLATFSQGWVEAWDAGDHELLWQRDLGEPIFGGWFAGDHALITTRSGAFVVLGSQGEILARVQAHEELVSAAMTDDAKLLATTGRESQIKLWSPDDGRPLGVLTERAMKPMTVGFAKDGSVLFATDGDSRVAIWDVPKRVRLGTIDLGRQVASVGFTEASKTLVTMDTSGWIRTWDVRGDYIASVFADHRGAVWSAAIAPDGETISTFGADGTVRRWLASSGTPTGVLALRFSGNTSLNLALHIAYLPDGHLVAPYFGHAVIWDLARSAAVGMLPVTFEVFGLAAAGDRIAVANMMKGPTLQVAVWDAAGARLLAYRTTPSVIFDLAFDPSGRVAMVDDKQVSLWDVDGDRIVWTHSGAATDLDISRDGRFVGVANADGYLRILDARSGALLRSVKQPAGVNYVAFSPDGTLVATANTDFNIYVWDTATGQLGCVLTGHTLLTNGLVFTPDGTKLVSVGRDQRAIVWTLPYERRSPAELAKRIAERVPFRLVGADLVTNETP